jgi:hypothetical protein
MPRLRSAGFALLLLLASAAPAAAQYDFVNARALGMGEALRGAATGAAGPLLNPAGMSLIRQYSIEADYGLRIEDLGHHVHVSIVDSITTRVAAGLYYNFVHATPQLSLNWAGGRLDNVTLLREGHTAGLALSVPIGRYVILGATIKYLNYFTQAPLPQGTVPEQLQLDRINGVSFDASLLLRFAEKFHATVIGYNLWDHGSRETPLSLGIGLTVIPIGSLLINFDTVINFTGYKAYERNPIDGSVTLNTRVTARLGPGIEYMIKQMVPIRIGLVYDHGQPGTYLTAGLGYVHRQFAIDLGYRGKVAQGVENTLLLGLRVFVN